MKTLSKIALACSLVYAAAANATVVVSDPAVTYTIQQSSSAIDKAIGFETQAIKDGFSATWTGLQQLGVEIYQLGTAMNAGLSQVANTVAQSSTADRNQMITNMTQTEQMHAVTAYSVPGSICSESGSGSAASVTATSAAGASSLRPGGGAGGSNSLVKQALATPPQSSSIDSGRAATIHAQYCDEDDFNAYGGTGACPSVSNSMPGADKRLDSVLNGAGQNNKAPDLTFDTNKGQDSAAVWYTQNTVRRSIAPQLRKGAASTTTGAQYVGLMNQYNSIISAAAHPQDQRIADSMPNPATQQGLADTLQSPSAAAYFQQVGSPYAKSHNVMSTREFEHFDAGRRYSNIAYEADLAAMTPENVEREKVRVMSQYVYQQGVVSGNGKYSTLRIFTPTSFNDIQHGIFA